MDILNIQLQNYRNIFFNELKDTIIDNCIINIDNKIGNKIGNLLK